MSPVRFNKSLTTQIKKKKSADTFVDNTVSTYLGTTNSAINTFDTEKKDLRLRQVKKNKILLSLTGVFTAVLAVSVGLCFVILPVGLAVLSVSITLIVAFQIYYVKNKLKIKQYDEAREKLDLKNEQLQKNHDQQFLNSTLEDLSEGSIVDGNTSSTVNTKNSYVSDTKTSNTVDAPIIRFAPTKIIDSEQAEDNSVISDTSFRKYHFSKILSKIVNDYGDCMFVEPDPMDTEQCIKINTSKASLQDLNNIKHNLYIKRDIYYYTDNNNGPNFSANIIPLANVIIDGDLNKGTIDWLKSLPDMPDKNKPYVILNKKHDSSTIEEYNSEIKEKAVIIQIGDLLPEKEDYMSFGKLVETFNFFKTDKELELKFDIEKLSTKNKQIFLNFVQKIYKQHRNKAVIGNNMEIMKNLADGFFELCNFMAQDKENTKRVLEKIKEANKGNYFIQMQTFVNDLRQQ